MSHRTHRRRDGYFPRVIGFTSFSSTNQKSGESLSLNELVQTLIPYTERHLARLERLVQDSYILDYVLGEMDGGLLLEDEMDID